LKSLEDGVHTRDIWSASNSHGPGGTAEFARAVISRLGQRPSVLPAANYTTGVRSMSLKPGLPRAAANKVTVGVDVFVQWTGTPDELAARLQACASTFGVFDLAMITCRGVKVWPNGFPETTLVDHYRCRFMAPEGDAVEPQKIVELLSRIANDKLDFIKIENLCTFDGEPGFSLGQGQ